MTAFFPFLTVFLIPMVFGVGLLVIPMSALRKSSIQIVKSSPILAAIGAFTVFLVEDINSICTEWLAAAETMCVGFEKSAILIVLFLTVGFYSTLIIYPEYFTRSSTKLLGFMFISFAAANVAILTNHFLMRYIALELVGLSLVGISLLHTISNGIPWRNAGLMFLNFKIGDLGLLSSILFMHSKTLSFSINENLTQAIVFPSSARSVIIFCLLVSIWVKLAIWPLNIWLNTSSSLFPGIRSWFTHLLLPVLGVYLLYRSTVLIQSNNAYAITVFLFINLALLINEIQYFFSSSQGRISSELHLFSFSCLVLLATRVDQHTFWAYMVLWVMVSIIVELCKPRNDKPQRKNHEITKFLYLSSQFLFLGFLMLVIWKISQLHIIGPFAYVIVWIAWWQNVFRFIQIPNAEKDQGETGFLDKAKLKLFLGASICSVFCLLVLIFTAESLTSYFKHRPVFLFPREFIFPEIIFFIISFWAGFLISILIKSFYGIKRNEINQFQKRLNTFLPQHLHNKTIKPGTFSKDPLDFTNRLSNSIISIFQFIYNQFERSGIEKMIYAINRVFKYLFERIERFTSADLWVRILHSVTGSSKSVQKAHTGLLRVNLLWMAIFILILIILVISFNFQSYLLFV